jgi:HAMP domain-containing protein
MTLRARLTLGLGLIAIVLVAPLFVARSSLQRLHDQVRSLREGEFQASLLLGRLRDALADVRSRELAMGVVKSDTVHAQLQDALARAGALADSLDRHAVDSAARRIRADLAATAPAVEREYAAVRSGNIALADTISQSIIAPALRDADGQLLPAEQLLRARTRDRVLEAESAVADAQRVTLLALAAALLLAAIVALLLTRSINQPVIALEAGMRAVAEGELDHPLELRIDRRDEFGRLAVSFREMSRQLVELDKLKAEFVSIASHELKTPINVILGYLTLMQEGVYGPLSD